MELGRIMRCSLDGNKEEEKKSVKHHFNKCELFYDYLNSFIVSLEFVVSRVRKEVVLIK